MPAIRRVTDGGFGPDSRAAWRYEVQLLPLVRQVARLQSENERLRGLCDSLTGSAEVWIRLYESALERARRAESRAAALAGR